MARSIQVIYDSMVTEGIRLATDAGRADVVAMFGNTSRVALWKILFYAMAFCANALETLFDILKGEIDDDVASLRPATARWFVEKAKDFQYGYDLVPESDVYDNTGLTDDQIAASKIVAYAACVDQPDGIRLKLAKIVGDDLGPLSDDEMNAVDSYWAEVQPAGSHLSIADGTITSGVADDLQAKLRIYYNAQVLRGDGGRIDGADDQPVQNALNTFLKNLPFNGLFVPMMAVDALQAVEGVVIVKDDYWQSRFGALDFTGIDIEYTPDAGYLRLTDDGLDIEFIPHATI